MATNLKSLQLNHNLVTIKATASVTVAIRIGVLFHNKQLVLSVNSCRIFFKEIQGKVTVTTSIHRIMDTRDKVATMRLGSMMDLDMTIDMASIAHMEGEAMDFKDQKDWKKCNRLALFSSFYESYIVALDFHCKTDMNER